MAKRLKLIFADASGGTTTHTYNYANSEARQQDITALINTTITNGSIFQRIPTAIKSAAIVVTTETDVTPVPNP